MGGDILFMPKVLALYFNPYRGVIIMRFLLFLSCLILLGLTLTSCSTSEKPSPHAQPVVIVDDEPIVITPTEYSFKWNKSEWTRILIDEMKSKGWDNLKTSDMKDFGYVEGMDLLKFWGNIVVEIAKWESGFDPRKTYKEPFRDGRGNRVISSGLFQISIESANNRNRGNCGFTDQEQLYNPELNIRCSIAIMDFFLREYYVIRAVNPNKGLARYWSVVRGTSSSYTRDALKAIKAANK